MVFGMVRITHVLIDGEEVPLPKGYIVEEDEDFIYVARPDSMIVEIYSAQGIRDGRDILNILVNYDIRNPQTNPVDELLYDLGIPVDETKDELDNYKF